VDEIQEIETVPRIFILVGIAVGVMATLFQPTTQYLFEDSHWLPVTSLAVGEHRIPHVLSFLLWKIGAGTPVGHHLLNLGIHGIVSVFVGLVGVRLWASKPAGWACASLFWLHPLAIPAIGYASALPEMLVALGSVLTAWILLLGWTWYVLTVAGVVIAVTLSVKSSAIGVVAVPLLILLVRPIRWKTWGGEALAVIMVGGFLVGPFVQYVFTTRVPYSWADWPSEMLSQSSHLVGFILNGWLPLWVTFQFDWVSWQAGAGALVAGLITCLLVWSERAIYPVEAFALLWVPALIGIRLLIPAVTWPERAPELLYAQQCYPALPGMVWLIVGVGRRIVESCYPVPILKGSPL